MPSFFRRAGAAILRFTGITADPPAEAGRTLLYSKDVAGVAQAFARASDGTISQLTPVSGGVSSLNLVDGACENATVNITAEGTIDWYALAAAPQDRSLASGVIHGKASGDGGQITAAMLFNRAGRNPSVNTSASLSIVAAGSLSYRVTTTGPDATASTVLTASNLCGALGDGVVLSEIGWNFRFPIFAGTTRVMRIRGGGDSGFKLRCYLTDGTPAQELVYAAVGDRIWKKWTITTTAGPTCDLVVQLITNGISDPTFSVTPTVFLSAITVAAV